MTDPPLCIYKINDCGCMNRPHPLHVTTPTFNAIQFIVPEVEYSECVLGLTGEPWHSPQLVEPKMEERQLLQALKEDRHTVNIQYVRRE